MAENIPVLTDEKGNEEHLKNQPNHFDDIYGVDFLFDEYVILVNILSFFFAQ